MDGFTVKPVPHRTLTLEVRCRRMWTVAVIGAVWRVALWVTDRLLRLAQVQMREERGRWQTLPDRLRMEVQSTLEWQEQNS